MSTYRVIEKINHQKHKTISEEINKTGDKHFLQYDKAFSFMVFCCSFSIFYFDDPLLLCPKTYNED